MTEDILVRAQRVPQLVARGMWVPDEEDVADEIRMAFAEAQWECRIAFDVRTRCMEVAAHSDVRDADPHAILTALNEVLWRWRGGLVVQEIPLPQFSLVDARGAWRSLMSDLSAWDPDGHLVRAWERRDRPAALSAVRRVRYLLDQRGTPAVPLADTLFA